MKKILVIMSLLFLSACFGGQKEQEEIISEVSTNEPIISVEDESLASEEEIQEEAFMEVLVLDDKNFIEITPLASDEIQPFEVQIKGKVLDTGVDKITVHFENSESNFPEDDYMLQPFSQGDESFRYVASAGFRVLDFGENHYTFTAYKGEESSSLEVIIFIPKEESEEEKLSDTEEESETKTEDEKEEIDNKEVIGSGGVSKLGVEFPVSEILGRPILLSNEGVSYENDKNLMVSQKETSLFSCETSEKLNDYLFENYSWVYWNTCRNIVYTPQDEDTKGIYFNVLYLDGENYFYERHYIDFENGLYGVYLLETGNGVDKTNIAEKNSELKQKEFNNLEEVNKIFETILQ